MIDAANANLAKYKAGFKPEKKTFIKTSPFKLAPGMPAEQVMALGGKAPSYPTPINSSKQK